MEQYPCDKCGEPVPVKLKIRKYPGNIEENYIQCPSCKEEYTSFVTDDWARREQKEVRKLHERYTKKRSRLSVHMEKLKQQIASG